MSITTKTGDDGYTSLLNGERVPKYDLRVELIGTMDELSSYLGLAKSQLNEEDIINEISCIQRKISLIMAQAASGNCEKYNIEKADINNINEAIKRYEGMYLSENKFIIPGSNNISAIMDVTRTVARKVERQALNVDKIYPMHNDCKIYLNRLSDYIYAVARYIDFKDKIKNKVMEVIDGFGLSKKYEEKHNKAFINLSTAKEIIEKVEVMASEMNLPVVIAVANEWGNIIAVHFMDGALPGSYDIAVDKAYTSAVLRLTTEEIGKLSKCGESLFGIGNTNKNRIITFGGGYPLKAYNKVLGGIGVSGGSAEQDIALSEYGASFFGRE